MCGRSRLPSINLTTDSLSREETQKKSVIKLSENIKSWLSCCGNSMRKTENPTKDNKLSVMTKSDEKSQARRTAAWICNPWLCGTSEIGPLEKTGHLTVGIVWKGPKQPFKRALVPSEGCTSDLPGNLHVDQERNQLFTYGSHACM